MLRRKCLIQQDCNETLSINMCYAKTCFSGTKNVFGKTVDSHCKIVGNIAKYLLGNYCLKGVRSFFTNSAPLIAAVHDLGKISPTFQLKLKKAVEKEQWIKDFPALKDYENYEESLFGGHPTVSYAVLRDFNEKVAVIAGQHHGALHKTATSKNNQSDGFGGCTWANLRKDELSELCKYFGTDLEDLRNLKLSDEQVSLLSGLTCVSDWIGSGSYFDNQSLDFETDIKNSVLEAGFRKLKVKKNQSFEDIFGFSPNLIQSRFLMEIDVPGTYIVEAPMGIGKTEIALFAAYKLLASDQASGIYFALPTQLTSNKIYERFSQFLSKIVESSDQADKRSLLLHSNASLIRDSLGEEGAPGNSWFLPKKRGLLYPFAVGTLDQALLAVMNVRHSFVRSFGLAGKVVIIDEVHTYDCYTGTILDYLVKHLNKIGCTVIILSATLNEQRRNEILGKKIDTEAYPVMSFIKRASGSVEGSINGGCILGKKVQVVFNSQSTCLHEALNRAKTGQQVLWIQNTVSEAQSIYKDLAYLAKKNGIECGLLHSRFTQVDRDKKEDYWVNLLGKNTSSLERARKGRILIGTQVLEQSLDIDADFLITKFAPTDMLLQRIGRLWRHSATSRPQNAECEVWIENVDFEESLSSHGRSFGLSSMVYSPYVLCRSLETWKQSIVQSTINIPSEIRPLINSTYSDRDESDSDYQILKQELYCGTKNRKGVESLRSLARSSVSKAGIVLDDDEDVSTRYSSEKMINILILKEINCFKDYSEIEFADGTKFTLKKNVNRASKQIRQISVDLMKHTVKCSKSKAPVQITIAQAINIGLSNYLYVGSKEDLSSRANTAVMLIDKIGKLNNFNSLAEDKYSYKYTYEKGLEVEKRDGI